VRLAGRHHRVDEHAVIVVRGVAHQRDLAGLAVDLDLGDVGAVGERHPLARPGVIGVERRARAAGARGEVEQRYSAIGADHDELPGLERDVGLGGLERLDGEALRGLGPDEQFRGPEKWRTSRNRIDADIIRGMDGV
jgi:hypothetical protein